MRGDRLTAEALSIRPDIPVILVTGYGNAVDIKRVKQGGVIVFILHKKGGTVDHNI